MSEDNLYKIVNEFTKSLSEAGIVPSEKTIDPIKEIPVINEKLRTFNYILISVIAVLGIAFLGFVFDAIYFHITNNRYFENVYELKNSQNEKIDRLNKDVNSLKEKHPELFK